MERVLSHSPLLAKICLAIAVVSGLLLFAEVGWCASSSVDAKTTVVEGVGPNRDLALKDAWRNAVESTVGGFVASATLVENHQLIEDYILAYADGYIEDFDVLGEGYRRGNYWIKIRAKVKKGLLLNTLKRHKIDIEGESLYATLTTNKQAKNNRAEICKLELGQWDYPRDYATVTCDIEVLPDIMDVGKFGVKRERAVIKASNIRVDVDIERMERLREWILEARRTNNHAIEDAIWSLYGCKSPIVYPCKNWWGVVALHLYDKNGELLYEEAEGSTHPSFDSIGFYHEHVVPRKTYWGFNLMIDWERKSPLYYHIPVGVLKKTTKVQPVVIRIRRGDADYTEALELNQKKAADNYYNRGRAYDEKGQNDKAIADYTKALEFDPRNISAYFFRGNAYESLEQYDKAIADYTKALGFDPRNVDLYNIRGLTYLFLDQYDKAIADYTKALEFDPRNSHSYSMRGFLYTKKGQNDKAIADYTKALEFDPKRAYLYYHGRGRAYWNLGVLQQAINDYKLAARLGNDDSQDFLKSKGINW